MTYLKKISNNSPITLKCVDYALTNIAYEGELSKFIDCLFEYRISYHDNGHEAPDMTPTKVVDVALSIGLTLKQLGSKCGCDFTFLDILIEVSKLDWDVLMVISSYVDRK